MGYRIGNFTMGIESFPGRKRKVLYMLQEDEGVNQYIPLAYFLTDDKAKIAENFLEKLVKATLKETHA